MATKKVARGSRAPKKRTERPVTNEIRRAAERAGITRGAEIEQRKSRLLIERQALAARGLDSLRSRILRIVGAGAAIDQTWASEDTVLTPERALLRYAAATSKAVGLALMGFERVCSNANFDVDFSSEDAAIVMCGLSELLEVGPALVNSIVIAGELHGADAVAPQEIGGGS